MDVYPQMWFSYLLGADDTPDNAVLEEDTTVGASILVLLILGTNVANISESPLQLNFVRNGLL